MACARTGKRGDFLGQASLGWEDLDLRSGETSRELNLKLGFRDGVPRRDQELVQGTTKLLLEAPVIEVRRHETVSCYVAFMRTSNLLLSF